MAETFRHPVARIAHSNTYDRSARAARRINEVLIKNRPQIHFQERVCDLENSTSELAQAFGFGDGVGTL